LAASDLPELIGQLEPKTSQEIAASAWSIGCETLDRDYAVYEHYRAWLGRLGAKHVRLQAGWAKCERTPGKYDFSWLDAIVNDAIAQGVQPWLELSYGNPNYPGGGGTGLGGGLPNSDVALAAWERWVAATVRHFRDRVSDWEIWNEPDLNRAGIQPEQFADFHIRTAHVVRREAPHARIRALALAGNVTFARRFLERIHSLGETGTLDAITVHGYPVRPEDLSLVHQVQKFARQYAPHAVVIQGETGAPSTPNTFGALRGHPWTETAQAIWNLRRMLAHFSEGIEFNLFTLMELKYSTGWNTKGLLKSDDAGRVVRPKPAYDAARHVMTLFTSDVVPEPEFPCAISSPGTWILRRFRHRPSGTPIVAIWRPADLPAVPKDSASAELRLPKGMWREPVWVDLLSGDVRALCNSVRVTASNEVSLLLPVPDWPVVVAERSIVPMRTPTSSRSRALEAHRRRWQRADLQAEIEANIRRVRQREGPLQFLWPDGRPATGIVAEVKLRRHEFLFGVNGFVLGQLPTSESNRQYEEALLRLFNFVTVPFYWAGTEPAPGQVRYEDPAPDIWRRPPPGRFLRWAATNGVVLKGHPLLWHSHNPSWLPTSREVLQAAYRRRFDEIASRFAQKIPIWDVVNESLVCPEKFPLFSPDRQYVAWAFHEVAARWPSNAVLMINEVTRFHLDPPETNPYLRQVRQLLAQGVPVRGIGFQFHFFRTKHLDEFLASERDDPSRLRSLYAAFAELNLPLFVTEITIPSAGEQGERIQAEVVRDYYRLWFSTPGMHGITWWNLADGTAVQGENEAEGGLLDDRLNPKAAYRALEDLIGREWTTQAQLHTDSTGRARLRGFFGDYDVVVRHNGEVWAGSFAWRLGSGTAPVTVVHLQKSHEQTSAPAAGTQRGE
jgi:GH35 family endo-1,4-beta-xylanase